MSATLLLNFNAVSFRHLISRRAALLRSPRGTLKISLFWQQRVIFLRLGHNIVVFHAFLLLTKTGWFFSSYKINSIRGKKSREYRKQKATNVTLPPNNPMYVLYVHPSRFVSAPVHMYSHVVGFLSLLK